jgi:hypothetical protein
MDWTSLHLTVRVGCNLANETSVSSPAGLPPRQPRQNQIDKYGENMPEIRDWKWDNPK